jgi:ketosteroid isomerase-like protein
MSTATLSVPVSKDEADIHALIESMLKANHDKNAAACATAYATDAAVYNLAPPLVHHGIDLKEKQAWYDTWATPIDLESRDFKISVSGDLAFGYGFVRLTGTKKSAEVQVSFWMRETLCFERVDGAWRIIHEHTSVPFYMDGTLRPAFDLRP